VLLLAVMPDALLFPLQHGSTAAKTRPAAASASMRIVSMGIPIHHVRSAHDGLLSHIKALIAWRASVGGRAGPGNLHRRIGGVSA
jgi:hypothetical protein